MNKKKRTAKSLEKGFFFITKSILRCPKTGNKIKILHGGKTYPVIIKSIPCVRAGHEKHYYHLKVNFHELKPGDLIEITKDSEKGYLLSIKDFFKNNA